MQKIIFLAFVVFIVQFYYPNSQAQNLLYPELQVVPKATDRIDLEAKQENSSRWQSFAPYEISALATLVAAGIAKSKDQEATSLDDFSWSQKTSNLIGGAWLGLSLYMWYAYKPYTQAQAELKTYTIQGKSPQEQQLFKERMAEEKISEAASVGQRLMYLSITTNLIANAYLSSKADKTGQIASGIGALLAFSPLIFKTEWQKVHNYHQDYKRKIFAPIVATEHEILPGFTMAMTF